MLMLGLKALFCAERCTSAMHRLAKIAKFLGLTKQRKNQWKNNAAPAAKKDSENT